MRSRPLRGGSGPTLPPDRVRHPARTRGARPRGFTHLMVQILVGLIVAPVCGADGPGLLLELSAGSDRDLRVASNVWLRVAPGATPSPWLAPGPFQAVWSGSLVLDLRGTYRFQAEVLGDFTLELNGTTVLSAPDASGPTPWSEPVRLRQGPNTLRATFARTDAVTEARLRLSWQGRGVTPGPIPTTALLPPELPVDFERLERIRRGRAVFLDRRCGQCHEPDVNRPVPELTLPGPTFQDIGNRRSEAWMARWIAGASLERPGATMPRLVHGPEGDAEARAMAAWLASLREGPPPMARPGNAAVGQTLFKELRCDGCHSVPQGPTDLSLIALDDVATRFEPGALAGFLMRPEAHHRGTRMPNFGLSEAEADHLAAWLMNGAGPGRGAVPSADPALRERGRTLVQTRGCLACHEAAIINSYRAPALSALHADSWNRGCLADDDGGPRGNRAPIHALTAGERDALRAWATTDRASLGRHVPDEHAVRWIETLRCGACHDQGGGIPNLVHTGEKLRPEWVRELLAGEVAHPARPWLATRMPAFPAYAKGLAEGMAARHGLPPVSPVEPPPDPDAAEVGRRLVTSEAGFSCVSCHAIGSQAPTAVFDAYGIDFARSAARLLPDFFVRWMLDPLAIDPVTTMPKYFDEHGDSPLGDVYGGDGPRTIRALWEYLRLGTP
ncbi:MAG: c-type cytochrome [Verrucomicrobiae bacterium]|nr:c-type cytochrome [Verrucomicrobiae bacterium]